MQSMSSTALVEWTGQRLSKKTCLPKSQNHINKNHKLGLL